MQGQQQLANSQVLDLANQHTKPSDGTEGASSNLPLPNLYA